ncbi:MAG: EAL domain-containing protein [Methyloceanibacter sp.]
MLAYVCAETATDGQWLQGLEEFTGEDGRSLTERLTIEITETAAISDFAETVKFVRALKALGRSVALDDFGAGYTSYRSLRTFGLAMVNIDGSFIQNLGTEAEDERLVRTLIELARSFGVSTVGERWATRKRRGSSKTPASPTCRAISSVRRSLPRFCALGARRAQQLVKTSQAYPFRHATCESRKG